MAKEKPVEKDTYDYDNIVSSIRGVQAPQIIDDYIVFTAENNARLVGIAFDYENYSVIHPYSLRKTWDYEGEMTGSWYFYILEKPKKIQSISYKLVIDGLWTTDPSNPESFYDWENGIELSRIKLPAEEKVITETLQEGYTKFICNAEPGQKVRLGGSFTNWDSWIYEMTEVAPGKYEISLPLPPGIYYYAYFTGLKRFIDDTNPLKTYSADGKMASQIIIQ